MPSGTTPGLNRPSREVKADLFKALAHPGSGPVLEVLSEGERTVGELQPLVGIESSHLVRNSSACCAPAGLVTTR